MKRMDCSHSEEELMDSSKVTIAEELEAEDTQAAKRRKVTEKTVVRVKIEAGNEGKQRSEGPPSDCWSWRKYGQKPIKGSPYPRGYYRCSTSKGCSAKKQVERCKTDATMLIITYTSSHNHPDPDLPSTNVSISKQTKESKSNSTVNQPTTPEKEQEEKEEEKGPKQVMEEEEEAEKEQFHYCKSPFNYSQDMIISHHQHDNYPLLEKAAYDTPSILLYEEEPLCYPPSLMSFSGTKSEENDFYDELEELPSSSSSASYFFRSNFFDERILLI